MVRTVAAEDRGIEEALAAARQYDETGLGRRRLPEIWAARVRDMLRERLLDRFDPKIFEEAGCAIASHQADPYSIIEKLLKD